MSRTLTLLFLVTAFFAESQNTKLDSLQADLKNAKHDTMRLKFATRIGHLYRNSNPDSAKAYHRKAIKFAEKAGDDRKKAIGLNELAWDHVMIAQNEEGLKLFREAIALVEMNLKKDLPEDRKTKFDHVKSDALANIGLIQFKLGEYDKAVASLEKAYLTYKKMGDVQAQIGCLGNLGLIYQERGNYTKALEYFNKILELNRTLNDKLTECSILNNMASIFMYQDNYSLSLEYNFKALRIAEEMKDDYSIAGILSNIGVTYRSLKDYDKALEYYLKALAINEKTGNKEFKAANLSGISGIYYYKNNFTEAIRYLQDAQKLDEEIGDKHGLADSYTTLGIIYRTLGDSSDSKRYEIAQEFFEKALKMHQELESESGLCSALAGLGRVQISLGKYKDAERNLRNALKLATKMEELSQALNCHESLYLLFKKTNRADSALRHHELLVAFRDSIFNEEKTKSSARQELKFSYEKKAAADSLKVAQERQVTDLQLKQEKNTRLALYGGLAMIFIFSLFMYNRFRITQKQKKIIELKEQETQKQNEIISVQKHLVEEKQKEIIDSINYAKRIQNTLLANDAVLQKNIPDHFVLFKPKDIVSGDFYWATEQDNKFYIAVCDSTGHGVPGAFMSLLNISFLNEAISEKALEEPSKVLDFVRQRLIDNISKEGQKDGFDGILVCFDRASGKITYAAANNAPILIQDGQMIELEADRMPVGKGERTENFTLREINYENGNTLYLYTDGYPDQFGGPRGKKYMYKKLNENLLKISKNDLGDQLNSLKKDFEDWKGDLEQVDDVCVIGIKL